MPKIAMPEISTSFAALTRADAIAQFNSERVLVRPPAVHDGKFWRNQRTTWNAPDMSCAATYTPVD